MQRTQREESEIFTTHLGLLYTDRIIPNYKAIALLNYQLRSL
ncbi:MAG: hypothetical protein RMY36_015630 [Nostoc sp. SerVER01]|nr:hypothetical protein [Nostoc sp. SerVER01]